MQVPLLVDPAVNYGQQYLKIWSNGKKHFFKSPIEPYCYTQKEPPAEAKSRKVKKRLLYNIQEKISLFKCTFRTITDLKNYCNGPEFYESHFNFRDRIYTNCPELITNFANTDDLKICCIDFEMDTYGNFPNPQENAIIACGLQFNDKPIELILAPTYNDDRFLLDMVLMRIEQEDPDIFVTFNGVFFDFPYMIERLKINRMSTERLSRDGSEPYVSEKSIKLGGRIVYDEYTRSAMRDQNLFKWSPPDRRMKTVAKIYGLDDVVEEPASVMGNMRAMVGTPELKKYLYSDIRCTKFLYDIYFKEIINMAETLGISLESCVNSSPSYIGHMLFAKQYEKLGIISDKTVGEAYPDIIHDKAGALVGCFKPGLYRKGLKKKDIQSDYPNIVRTLNLSPETCQFIRIEDKLRPFEAHMDHDLQYLTLEIPDEKLKKQLVIGIDFSTRGFASSFVDKAMTDRLKMKKKMKSLDPASPEYSDLDVNQLSLKVIMNSITGFFGQEFSAFGSLACYCAITGVGRFLISNLIKFLGGVIALDTDGVITDDNISIDAANQWLEEFVLSTFQVPKNYMKLEEEEIFAGFFRAEAKQYLLVEKDNDGKFHFIVHGASYKGSNLPNLFTTIIQDIGFKMLMLDETDKNAVKQFEADIARYYDKSTWTLNLIKKNNTCKPKAEYKTSSSIGVQLIEQYEKRFGKTIKYETKLDYVKVKRKIGSSYQLITIFDSMADIDGLDFSYYEEIVDNAFTRLNLLDKIPRNLKAGKQKKLFDFFEN